jgi:hypothetical protein
MSSPSMLFINDALRTAIGFQRSGSGDSRMLMQLQPDAWRRRNGGRKTTTCIGNMIEHIWITNTSQRPEANEIALEISN